MGFSGETLLVAGGGAGEVIFISVAAGGAGGAETASIIQTLRESAGVLGNSASSRQRSGASAIITQRTRGFM
jgi:hypothetical protein